MVEHRDPDCTGTWTLEPEDPRLGRQRVRCTVCAADYPADVGATLEAMQQNLVSMQLITLGLMGRLL